MGSFEPITAIYGVIPYHAIGPVTGILNILSIPNQLIFMLNLIGNINNIVGIN
tara:strand:+ start:168 stop:326 length:159 start_codon:yes stop_codon:yes gene_type:complete